MIRSDLTDGPKKKLELRLGTSSTLNKDLIWKKMRWSAKKWHFSKVFFVVSEQTRSSNNDTDDQNVMELNF